LEEASLNLVDTSEEKLFVRQAHDTPSTSSKPRTPECRRRSDEESSDDDDFWI
jgi:hypothetical protein